MLLDYNGVTVRIVKQEMKITGDVRRTRLHLLTVTTTSPLKTEEVLKALGRADLKVYVGKGRAYRVTDGAYLTSETHLVMVTSKK